MEFGVQGSKLSILRIRGPERLWGYMQIAVGLWGGLRGQSGWVRKGSLSEDSYSRDRTQTNNSLM